MDAARYEVEFVRASAPTRVWSKRSFPNRAAARRAARDSIGKPLRDSGSPIVAARLYERTHIDTYGGTE